jgi:ribosomal protein L12E/L44/L45/RPP1/RPP2
MLRNKGKIVLIVSVLAGLAGCATTSDIDSLRAEIKQANETANSAAATADAASKEAAAASQTADEAKASAEEANNKIDRMFKKSMYK